MSNYVRSISDQLSEEFPGKPDDLIALYTLVALVKGPEATEKDVHDAWAVWRHITHPENVHLVPFEDLDPEIIHRDTKYVKAIHRIVA